VRVNVGGDVALSDEMRDKGIRLLTSIKTSTFYMGFNMLDPVVGGLSLRSTKLRQAISIAIDQEEFISIFSNGRGIAAQSALPPGIFGYAAGEEGIDKHGLRLGGWQAQTQAGRSRPKSCWPTPATRNGRDEKSGEPLVVNLDTTSGGMGEKVAARLVDAAICQNRCPTRGALD
jgi:oligopeptide transport system substrate-binding protein